MAMTVGRMGGERQATGCGQRAAGKQDLSMQYFSPYYAEPLKIRTLVSCGVIVVYGIVALGKK